MSFIRLLIFFGLPLLAIANDIRDSSRDCALALNHSFRLSDKDDERTIVSDKIPGINPKIWRTDRGANKADPVTRETLRKLYPNSWFTDLVGLNVLDIGCGDGSFVRELNSGTFGATTRGWGLDLVLDELQKNDPHFIQGASFHMPIKSNSVDVAFATISFFHYTWSNSQEGVVFLQRSFAEIHRILKPGGRLRMSNITRKDLAYIQSHFPEFEINAKVIKGGESFIEGPYLAIELKKKE